MTEPDASMEDALAVGDGRQGGGSGGGGGETPAAAPLDPQPYRLWVRSISRKLLHQPPPKDPITLLASLSDALDQYAAVPNSLSSTHQMLRSLLALQRVTSSIPAGASSFLTDTSLLAACFEAHDVATRNSGGSAYDVDSFVRLVSLSTLLHAAWEELPLQAATTDLALHDPLLQWTGIVGAEFRADSTYEPASLPHIPTKAALSQAGEAANQLRGEFEELVGGQATRIRVREAYSRIALHLTESDRVWSLYRDFELAQLQRSKTDEQLEEVRLLYLARLKVPHRTIEETFQSFSTFVSTHLPPAVYESTLSFAQPYYSASLSLWRSREAYEEALSASANLTTYATWRQYFTHLTRGKVADIDVDFVAALYERCLGAVGAILPGDVDEDAPPTPDHEAAKAKTKKRLNKEAREKKKEEESKERERRAAEGEAVWTDYLAFMANSNDAGLLLPLCARANASRPDLGVLWAEHLLHLSRLRRPYVRQEEIFSSALGGGMIKSTEGLVRLLLARVDVEREDVALNLLASSPADFAADSPAASLAMVQAHLPANDEAFTRVYGLLEALLGVLHARGKDGQDPLLRLERLAAGWCARRGPEALPLVQAMWETALQLQPLNGHAVIEKARYHTSVGEPNEARALLKGAMGRNGMQPVEDVLREWETFETLWGSVKDAIWARNRCKREREKVWRQWYDAQQRQQQQQQQYASTAVAADQDLADATPTTSGKRKATDEPVQAVLVATASEDAKKSRTDEKRKTRNREACSIMISGMPAGTTEDAVRHFFRDCGAIQTIEGPRVAGSAADEGGMDVDVEAGADANASTSTASAMVEFEEQSSVAPARTKDLKRIGGASVRVVPFRECTLYVNNFPPEWTDDKVRAEFGRFGDIFGVRWPSLKFDSSRRFCYVTMTTTAAAQACLELHNTEVHSQNADDQAMTYTVEVKFSDPDRKAQRTDANRDQRSLYVKNIPPDVDEAEVRTIFEKWGTVTRFSMPKVNGRLKGLAFIDYQTSVDAQFALGESAGLSIKGKLVNVSLADPNRGRSGGAGGSAAAAGSTGDSRAKSVRLTGLPSDAQEARIQQVVEGAIGQGNVEVVRFTLGDTDAVVQVKDASLAGRLALQSHTLQYDSHPLTIALLEARGAAAPISTSVVNGAESAASMVPRTARRGRGRGRGGGLARGPIAGARGPASDAGAGGNAGAGAASSGGLGPDAFRNMLSR